nr:crosslink repair DNA glycosylase YcaQ family protein [Salsipaludibacter albus]
MDRARPDRVDVRHLRRVVDDLDVVQLDSVNVVDRAHRLVFYSRLGVHDVDALDQWLWRSRDLHECWAHVASLMPTSAWPLLAHRRADATVPWKSVQRISRERPDFLADVLAQVRERGPLTVSDLEGGGDRTSGFWGWNPGRTALQWLFESGQLAIDHRDRTFRAAYDLPERVLGEVVHEPDVPQDEAVRALVLRAIAAQGVGTAADLADTHRLGVRETRTALAHLVSEGVVDAVHVDGWGEPAYALPDLVVPRRVEARALVAPFDPLVWFRPRVERVFGMHYRIEIYVPADRREYGYYVLPFVLGDQLVARVDLKAHRRRGVLEVRGAWAQPVAVGERDRVGAHLAIELATLGRHLGTPEVEVADHGDLTGPVRHWLP